MPVYRFRSVEEMERPHWRAPGDPALYRAMASLWATGHRTGAPRFPPGVYRHQSIESANAMTETWAVANFRAFRAARRTS